MDAIIAQPVFLAGVTNVVQVVKRSSGRLAGYFIMNPDTATAYIQFFDVAAPSSVILGTTLPVWSIGIPAGGGANLAGMRLHFQHGIQIAATTTATGSTAPGATAVVNLGIE